MTSPEIARLLDSVFEGDVPEPRMVAPDIVMYARGDGQIDPTWLERPAPMFFDCPTCGRQIMGGTASGKHIMYDPLTGERAVVGCLA